MHTTKQLWNENLKKNFRPERGFGPMTSSLTQCCQLSYQANCKLATLWVRNIPVEGEQYINNSRHLARKYARTVSYEEQIMSKDKYPSIFSPQMEAIVLIILQIFFATRVVLKIGEYSWYSPVLARGIFGRVKVLYQSRKSEIFDGL